MKTDLDWNEFCERYFETAKKYAAVHLGRIKAKTGPLDRRIDEDYVMDAAVLTALTKAFSDYDASRGARVTTFLSRIIHNELADELEKEAKQAARQDSLDDVETYVRSLVEEDSDTSSREARAKLIPRLQSAIENLSPDDQVILNFYLEDKSSYVDKSCELLHVGRQYVMMRCHRIKALLPKLMGMSREEYGDYLYKNENMIFSCDLDSSLDGGSFHSIGFIQRKPANPILPSLDVRSMARKLLEEIL